MRITKLLLLLFSTSLFLFAAHLVLDDVLKMYQQNSLKDSPEALELLKTQANSGNKDAIFLLATAYQNGKIGTVDVQQALHWYKVLAKNGDTDAMLMLGWLYYKEPTQSAINIRRARYWFKQAASKGVDEAVEMVEILRN